MKRFSHIVAAIALSLCGIAVLTVATLAMRSHDNAAYISLAVVSCLFQLVALAAIFRRAKPRTVRPPIDAPAHARGFTMIEVVVSLAIIVILAGILFPVASHALQSSKVNQSAITVAAAHSLVAEVRLHDNLPPWPEWYVDGVLADHSTGATQPAPYRAWRFASGQSWPMLLESETLTDDPATWTSDQVRNSILAWEAMGRVLKRQTATMPTDTFVSVTLNEIGRASCRETV